LRQLNLPATSYVWSRDLLAPRPRPFAYYCFNNGFGVVSPLGSLAFDNVSRELSDRTRNAPDWQLRLGQAMQQLTLADFARK